MELETPRLGHPEIYYFALPCIAWLGLFFVFSSYKIVLLFVVVDPTLYRQHPNEPKDDFPNHVSMATVPVSTNSMIIPKYNNNINNNNNNNNDNNPNQTSSQMLSSLTLSYNPRIPCAADPFPIIVQNLIWLTVAYKPGVEIADNGFIRRAVESLVKKLKKRYNELDSLITSVVSRGRVETKCATVQRTLDGRLQIGERKDFPHVTYARIWRWPDVHKFEMRSIDSCSHGFDLKDSYICINPYHYERFNPPGLLLCCCSLWIIVVSLWSICS